jgi:hypothetical protein
MKKRELPVGDGLRRVVAVALAVVPLVLGAQQAGPSAYVTDQAGSALRNTNYLCWHTGYWTPAAAIAECDPDLVARPSAKAASPPEKEPPVSQTAPPVQASGRMKEGPGNVGSKSRDRN